ncbi:MAG: hypothetical protein WBM44_13630 [Waterburya sp.]
MSLIDWIGVSGSGDRLWLIERSLKNITMRNGGRAIALRPNHNSRIIYS